MAEATETNRAVIGQAFEGLRHGNPSHFLPLFAEDIVWRVMGSSAWSKHAKGLPAVERDLVGPLFARFAGPHFNIPELILADGDHMVVLARAMRKRWRDCATTTTMPSSSGRRRAG